MKNQSALLPVSGGGRIVGGLVDKDGVKLSAVFKRRENDTFSRSLEEALTFDSEERFELSAWFDASEAWFNFTWYDSRYSAEFGKYLWNEQELQLKDFLDTIYSYLPSASHWLISCMLESDEVYERDEFGDDEFPGYMEALLKRHPCLNDPNQYNSMLEPVMRAPCVNEAVKATL